LAEYPIGATEGRELQWVCEITLFGEVFRWTTHPDGMDLTDRTGAVLHFETGLNVEFTEAIAFLDSAPPVPSVSIRDISFPEWVDIPALIEQGFPLLRMPVTLSLVVPGDTYEKRKIRFLGTASLSEYGSADELVSLTAEAEGVDTKGQCPNSEDALTALKWPDIHADSIGKYPPTVIGKPGFDLPLVHSYNCGSPGYVVDTVNSYLIIAGHHVVATTVDVVDISSTPIVEDNLAVVNGTDALGNDCAYVVLGGTCPYVDGDEYWVRWPSSLGGLKDPWGTACLEDAGQVIRWALSKLGATVDVQRWSAIRERLATLKIATYLDTPSALWSWLESVVFPLAPLSLATGPSGLYPVLWSPNDEPVAWIDVQEDGMFRAGMVQFTADWLTDISVHYAPKSTDGKFYFHQTFTGDQSKVGTDPTIHSSVHLVASRNRLGEKVGEPVELVGVYDLTTALAALTWKALAFHSPWRSVEYDDPDGRFAFLRPGDCVALTDSDLHWSDKRAWLTEIRWTSYVPAYTFTLIDDLVRDARM
jgi:hypothetical protein